MHRTAVKYALPWRMPRANDGSRADGSRRGARAAPLTAKMGPRRAAPALPKRHHASCTRCRSMMSIRLSMSNSMPWRREISSTREMSTTPEAGMAADTSS